MARAAQKYTLQLQVGETQVISAEGSFYKILAADGTVSIRRDSGSTLADLVAGQGEKELNFKRLTLINTSGAINNVTVIVADNTFIDDRVFGITGVSLSAMPGKSFVQTAAVVTNVNAAVSVANANRQYLLVQNNDPIGNVYLRLDGAVATVGTGIKIAPGGSYEADTVIPTGAIKAIGDIANNPNVVVVTA